MYYDTISGQRRGFVLLRFGEIYQKKKKNEYGKTIKYFLGKTKKSTFAYR